MARKKNNCLNPTGISKTKKVIFLILNCLLLNILLAICA